MQEPINCAIDNYIEIVEPLDMLVLMLEHLALYISQAAKSQAAPVANLQNVNDAFPSFLRKKKKMLELKKIQFMLN